jgi:peroxiredoxin
VEEEYQAAYKALGIDMVATYGNTKYELPIPATYVINSDGTILLSSVDYDYTQRLDSVEAIEVLKSSSY